MQIVFKLFSVLVFLGGEVRNVFLFVLFRYQNRGILKSNETVNSKIV